MKKLLGLHCFGDWQKYMNHIGLWKPPVVTILSPSRNAVQEVKKLSPNTVVVGRLYHDDSWYNDFLQRDPIGLAKAVNQEIIDAKIPEINYWQTINEPIPYWDKLENIKKFTNEWMRLADQAGYKCAILAWSVGNPDLPEHDRMVYWRQFTEVLQYAELNNHVVMLHQYNKPNLINNVEMDNWLIFRLEKQVIPNLNQLGTPNLKFIIGELGVDHLIASGKIGGFKETPLTDEQYVIQLLRWEEIEQAYAHNVIGSCIYSLGTQPPWDSYSISSNSNVISLLSTYYSNNANKYDDNASVEIPSTPTEGNKPMPDLQWDERLTKRGTKYELYKPQPNEGYYKLIKGEYLDEKEHIFVNVLDENGNHQYGVSVTIQWADGSTVIKTEDKSKDPYALADANFPMKGHSCSYTVRIGDKNDKVLCEGLGSPEQPNWNIHRSGRYTFQWVKASGSSTPEPSEPVQIFLPYVPNANTSGTQAVTTGSLVNVREQANTDSKIIAQLKKGTPIFITNRSGDFVKVGANAWVSKSWIKETNLETGPTVPTQPPATTNKTIGLEEFKLYLSRMLDIDVKFANAVLAVESGNRFFNEFGKPVIRTELHLLKNYLTAEQFAKHFRILGPKAWEGHEYRENESSAWKKFHGEDSGGGQAAESRVHEIAKQYNKEGAYRSASLGGPQILGSNYHLFNYNSAEEMYNEFAKSEFSQVAALLGYIANTDGWAALKANDIKRFIASYNGPGNVETYYKLFLPYL